MEHDNNRRPAERGRAAVTREKPRSPASRPRDSRPRSGSASTREAERRERMRSQEQTRTRSPEQTRSRDAAPARDRDAARQTRSAATERQAPAGDRAAAKAARKQADQRKRQQTEQRKRRQAEQRQRAEEPEPEAAKKRRKKPHRVYNTNFGFKFVTMLAVVAVIVLSMVIFFKVKHVEVVFMGVQPAEPVPLETASPTLTEAAALASGEAAPTGTGELPTGEGETAPETEGGETAPSETTPPETAQPAPPETAPALIEGHSCYTAEEIIEASGIHLDDNLLSLSKATVASRIHAALPYVNEIQIKKQLPGTVVITVSEFEVTYGIQDETGGWWLMSREGRILEAASEQAVRSHLVISGMPIQVPEPGDWIKPSAADGADLSEIAAKQKVILELIPALEETPFAKQIVRVDVSTSYDLTLWYGTRYEIRLGTVEELDYKLRFLVAVLEDKEIQRRSGTIDLTFNEDQKAHFMEFQ